MKKILVFLLIFVMIFSFSKNTYALSLDETNYMVELGKREKVSLYADLPDDTVEVDFTLFFDSYDIPVTFFAADGINDTNEDGPTHYLKFKKAASGKTLLGTVNIFVKGTATITSAGAQFTKPVAINSDGEKKTLTPQEIMVKIGKKTETPQVDTTPKNLNLLKEIQSEIVNITLVEDVFEYEVSVKSSIEELDLKGIPNEEKYSVSYSTQKIKDLEDGKILITVSNGKEKQVYTVKVKIIKEAEEVEIDTEEFVADNSYRAKWIVIIIILSVVLAISMVLNNKYNK